MKLNSIKGKADGMEKISRNGSTYGLCWHEELGKEVGGLRWDLLSIWTVCSVSDVVMRLPLAGSPIRSHKKSVISVLKGNDTVNSSNLSANFL